MYDLAKEKNPLIIEALNGTLKPLTEVGQNANSKVLSFDEKISLLSETERVKLAELAGVDVRFRAFKMVKDEEQSALLKLPSRAENRHTVFRQALAAFKRKQRASILMERAKIKRDGRS